MSDWSILGFTGGDPVPGDPATVATAGRSFGASADSLSAAATGLRRMAAGDNVGDTPAALIAKAGDLATRVQGAFEVCQRTGTALTDFASSLDRAQSQARQALAAASAQRSAYVSNASHANDFLNHAKTAQTPEQQDEFLAAYHRAKGQAETAQGNLLALRAKVEQAVDDVEAANRLAASRIQHVFDGTGMKDSAWDKLHETFDDIKKVADDIYHLPGIKQYVDFWVGAAKFVWEHIDEISMGLTLLALATSWIPGLNVVTAGLALAARIASLISMAKAVTEFAIALNSGDTHAIAGAGLSLALSLLLRRGSKMAGAKVSKSTVQNLGRLSRTQTGSLRYANQTLLAARSRTTSVQQVKDFITGATSTSRRIDALASTLRTTTSERAAQQLLTTDKLLHQAIGLASGEIGKLPEQIVDLAVPTLGAHRVVTTTCRVAEPVGA